jgi:cysteine desulfurase family protein
MGRVIYLNNAASSFPKPRPVIKAVARAMGSIWANPGRTGGGRALAADRLIYGARVALAGLLGIPSPERLTFTKNATEGINLALKGLLSPGESVAISHLEHNAVTRPLRTLRETGVNVTLAPADGNGLPDPARIPDVKMLVVTGASNVTGAIADLTAIGAACSKRGVLLMVDCAQSAGAIPFDITCVDILIGTGHKALLGPQGVGFAWFREGVTPKPLIEGGTGSESESDIMPSYLPDRLEAGTINMPGIAGLKAGVEYVKDFTIDAIREKEISFLSMIMDALSDEPGVTIYGPSDPAERASLLSFNVAGRDPSEISAALEKRGVAVRAGLHCAPSAHRFSGSFPSGAVRVSPGAMTRRRGVEAFIRILRKTIRRTR